MIYGISFTATIGELRSERCEENVVNWDVGNDDSFQVKDSDAQALIVDIGSVTFKDPRVWKIGVSEDMDRECSDSDKFKYIDKVKRLADRLFEKSAVFRGNGEANFVAIGPRKVLIVNVSCMSTLRLAEHAYWDLAKFKYRSQSDAEQTIREFTRMVEVRNSGLR